MIQIAGTIVFALIGIVFGGILNACIDTWTAREAPRSFTSVCRSCGAALNPPQPTPRPIRFALRRRCPHCGDGSTWRYPLVALSVGATWAVAAWQALPAFYLLVFAGRAEFEILDAFVFGLVRMIFCWQLIALVVMDAENRWLPDWFTLGSATLGLGFSLGRFAVYSYIYYLPLHWSSNDIPGSHQQYLYGTILHWVAAMIALPTIALLVRWIYHQLRDQEGTHLGEAKVMLMLAAWLGLSHTLVACAIGAVLIAGALLVSLLAKFLGKQSALAWIGNMPLASFLCIGGMVSGLWGRIFIETYLRWCASL